MFLLITFSVHVFRGWGQEIPPATEQQLESQAEIDQSETEDDIDLQQLNDFKKHPLNLNEATYDELKELIFLTDLQIDNLVSYRNLLGKFISIYELQAIPAWEVATIKKVLPYVTINSGTNATGEIPTRFLNGRHEFLIRSSEIMEKSEGYVKSKTGNGYLGSGERIFFRYRYQYKNLLQYGIVGDKDAGEQFFNGAQKHGFDFYSIHLFTRKIGKIKAVALGDFTVNMGQGLIQWQGLGFKKSSDVMGIKRQSAILRPHNSAGEFYFHRGVGVTLNFGKIEVTTYASIRKLSANVVDDSARHESFISSFLTSGYHRTQSEDSDRNNLRQISFGCALSYRGRNWHIGMNGATFNFSLPVQKRAEPYNLFAINGKNWSNFSVDYSYTFHNLHFFGEAAIDKNFNQGFLNGLLISVDPRVDLSILHRTISKAYQAVYGNAFTENSYPTNESGLYAGISIRPPLQGVRLDMYADVYKFPWIKYLVDAPSGGKDFLIQVMYTPNRQVEIFLRFRSETRQSDRPGDVSVINHPEFIPKKGWRMQLNYKVSQSVTLRDRLEFLWYDKAKPDAENGFLTFFDIVYTPLKRFSGNVRWQHFETDGYNSRVYAYENDVLYNYSIPAFFDKGNLCYINFHYDLKKNISVWLRWTETIFQNKNSIGSGFDQIHSNHRSEIKLQCEWVL